MFKFMDTSENSIYLQAGAIYQIYEPLMFDCPCMVGINTPQGLTLTSSFENPAKMIERYNRYVKEDGLMLFDISGTTGMTSTYRKDQLKQEYIDKVSNNEV